jgi:hypothetical protein
LHIAGSAKNPSKSNRSTELQCAAFYLAFISVAAFKGPIVEVDASRRQFV